MNLPKTKLREAVVQYLYSVEIANTSLEVLLPLIMDALELSKKNAAVAAEEARKVIALRGEFDSAIERVSKSYELERISKVDRTILHLALYLMKEGSEPAHVITEAIRLATKFSTPSAGAFIHAILDSVQNHVAV